MFKRILIAVDGSHTSTRALVAGLQLARESGGAVHLVHVVNEMGYLAVDAYGTYSADVIGIMRERGAKVLADAVAIAESAGVQAVGTLRDELPQSLGDAVAGIAGQWGADLIVVGSHGRSGLGRVLLGSGAEQIARSSSVPVLIFRHAPDEAVTGETSSSS